MTGHALKMVERGLAKPNGMILTSGPTGSGKSTTLYSLIRRIKSDGINIVTLEDPVEYKIGWGEPDSGECGCWTNFCGGA